MHRLPALLLFLGMLAASDAPLSAEALASLARSGTVGQVTAALAAGADVKGKGQYGRTALYSAVMWGAEPAVIAALIAAGADANATMDTGGSPLMAVGWGERANPETVALLLKAGADPAYVLSFSRLNALHMSVMYGDRPDLVTALIAAGVDCNGVDSDGWTVLDRARERQRTKSIAVLIEAHAQAGTNPRAVLQTGSPDAVRELVNRTKMDLNRPMPDSHIPMIEAAGRNPDPAVTRLLAELGGKVEGLKDRWGTSVMGRAASMNSNPEVISELIRLGASATAGLPLITAVNSQYRAAIVPVLITAAPEAVNAPDDQGRTALDHALANPAGAGMKEATAALRAAGGRSGGSIWELVQRGTLAKIETAIAAKTDLMVVDGNGRTLVMEAVMSRREPAVLKCLIAAGVPVDTPDQWGATALMRASLNAAAVPMLVAAGADPNASDKHGRRPLHFMCDINANIEVVVALLAAGADPTLPDQQGQSAFDWATKKGRADLLELFSRPVTSATPPSVDF